MAARKAREHGRVARRVRPAAPSRFARHTSRHISGLDAAMRVKSRNPPAAKENLSAASGASRICSTSANDSTCGKWLTDANTRSCCASASSGARRRRSRATSRRRVRPPRPGSRRADTARRCGSHKDRATRHRRRSTRAPRSDDRARTARRASPNAVRAAATTSTFVLPASVTMRGRVEKRRDAREQRTGLRDRRGEQHEVGATAVHVRARRHRRAKPPSRSRRVRAHARSTWPNARRPRFRARSPDSAARSRKARASDPPIRPTPKITSLLKENAATWTSIKARLCRGARCSRSTLKQSRASFRAPR